MEIGIMRGLPGSGKSKFITDVAASRPSGERRLICSADHYHTDPGGVYRYDPKKASEAHSACLRKYVAALTERPNAKPPYDAVFVDNTNTRVWELAPYAALAIAAGYDYEIIQIPCDLVTAKRRNIHMVTDGALLAMHAAMLTEHLPAHWKVTIHAPVE